MSLSVCTYVNPLSSIGLQAEFGDYEPDQPRPLEYISQLTFAPNQNKEMEEKILELHKSHRYSHLLDNSHSINVCH